MKRLLIVILTCLGIAAWSGAVFAENWGGGWRQGGQWEKWEKRGKQKNEKNDKKGAKYGKSASTRDERYCSYEQEGELLQLLKELDDPSLSKQNRPGGESEIHRKYRIARKLRKFDDCRAEDALQALVKEDACEDRGEGEIFCVKWGAGPSLQEVKSKKDLKKLTADTPFEDQLKIIKKYGPHPHENEFASHAVKEFLVEQVPEKPAVYVPLLVQYFPHCHELPEVAEKYPEEAVIGLKRSLFSTDSTEVWTAVNLARKLGKTELRDSIYGVAFEEIGPLDYSKEEDIEEIHNAAIGFFRSFEKNSVPYYRKILYSSYDREKEYVMSGIKDLTNPKILALLREFSDYLKDHPDEASGLLADRVQKKIAEMEAARK